jgi:hypothetical protein
MNVICKKGTTKLVKGHSYEVISMNNSNVSTYKSVRLKDFGSYSVKNFTTTDGKSLPEIDIPLPTNFYNRFELLKGEDVSKGDIIVCMQDRYKTLVKDGMYRVEEINRKVTPRTSYSGTILTPYVEYLIKFEGVKRKLKLNGWCFRKLTTAEARELALNQLLFDETTGLITTNDTRKIDLVQDKNLELLKIVSKSILDPNRHGLKILDWGIQQVSKRTEVKVDDYEDLLEMSLKDILDLIETN